ncbi:MAG: holo-ACP synthase [Minwuia sp.]|uniref:holo-ACP synthase n=1 Tax=Minwuia sp. TaxID=2493630 RepID=UPI003A865C4B
MILGIGVDLCDTRRIAQSMERFGQRFLDRCFTPAEQAACVNRADSAQRFARRYAAKEAASKALGTGIGEFAGLKEIEISSAPNGKPELTLSGSALETLDRMTPDGMTGRVHISLTDEGDLAQAFVILEALPA